MKYWDDDYKPMDASTFMIFRPPSSPRARRLQRKYRRQMRAELDKRWAWWHDVFKRKLLYGIARNRVIRWLMKKMI